MNFGTQDIPSPLARNAWRSDGAVPRCQSTVRHRADRDASAPGDKGRPPVRSLVQIWRPG